MSDLITITGDGTLAAPAAGSDAVEAAGGDLRLAALSTLRGLLGDPPAEQIGTGLYLPAALGTEAADQLLPSTLSLLAPLSGDLTSYGWRLGPGADAAWRRARDLRRRTLEAARIALYGYEGPLTVTALGPLTLAAGAHLASGQRVLADRGAVRDLPELLAEGIVTEIAELAERVPGSRPHVLIREDHADGVARGRIRVPSGRGSYPALPAAEIGPLWQRLREALPTQMTLAAAPGTDLLAAARAAGITAMAVAPARLGPLADGAARGSWEMLAQMCESGQEVTWMIAPDRIRDELEQVARAQRELGFSVADLAGMTVMGHRRPARGTDPAHEAQHASLLTAGDLESLLRAAMPWAERISEA